MRDQPRSHSAACTCAMLRSSWYQFLLKKPCSVYRYIFSMWKTYYVGEFLVIELSDGDEQEQPSKQVGDVEQNQLSKQVQDSEQKQLLKQTEDREQKQPQGQLEEAEDYSQVVVSLYL